MRRLVLCEHSHNDVDIRPSKVGKVINRSSDASMLVASPSATERGEALLIGAGYAARARKEECDPGLAGGRCHECRTGAPFRSGDPCGKGWWVYAVSDRRAYGLLLRTVGSTEVVPCTRTRVPILRLFVFVY